MQRIFRSLVFPGLMIIGVLVSAFVVTGSLMAATEPVSPPVAPASSAPARPVDLIAQGRALFVAKGCVVCHRHNAFDRSRAGLGDFYYEGAPNLTHVALDAGYLHRWLSDPKAIKPNTYMPNLDLSANEIDALIAFLTARR